MPETGLSRIDVVSVFEEPHQSVIDHFLHQFAYAIGEGDWSIVFGVFRVFSWFGNWDDNGSSPVVWEDLLDVYYIEHV